MGTYVEVNRTSLLFSWKTFQWVRIDFETFFHPYGSVLLQTLVLSSLFHSSSSNTWKGHIKMELKLNKVFWSLNVNTLYLHVSEILLFFVILKPLGLVWDWCLGSLDVKDQSYIVKKGRNIKKKIHWR